jgi:hypothetical protein
MTAKELASLLDGTHELYLKENVTHWMALPQGPDEKEVE